ncbi:hypothetical protein SAMN05192541_12232 [Bradyrhizobium arachidis]|nr:hypothetical protein SAMN05192541_12232 [Bradyrhizobium arachidis]
MGVVVRLAREQVQARLLSCVSLRTIPLKRFVNPSFLHGEPCLPVAAASSRKSPSMQTRDTARLTVSRADIHNVLLARTASPRALVASICRASALLWPSAHRPYAPEKFRTRSSSCHGVRGSGNLSGPLRIDRVLDRPPRPRTRKRRELTLANQAAVQSIHLRQTLTRSTPRVIAYLRRARLGHTRLR